MSAKSNKERQRERVWERKLAAAMAVKLRALADVKTEKAAKPISRAPALKASMSDTRPVLTAKSGASECLREDRDDTEEEHVPK